MSRRALLPALLSLPLALAFACGGGDDDGASAGGAGGGTAGSGTAGSGTSGSGTAGSGTSGSGTSGSGTGNCTPIPGKGLFEKENPWTKDVSCLDPSADSAKIIGALKAAGGWGAGNKLQIDLSIEVLTADASTPFKPFTKTGDWYPGGTCDFAPMPVPAMGAIEGEQGYACTNDGDCHLLVVHPPTKKLYEMWRANIVGNTFEGGCMVVWDLAKAYPDNLRGDGCTSADAGGFPISAMLFSADEVAAGELTHAIRFILPNARIRKHLYVHPATHSTSATSGGDDLPPYGVRLRLKKDFDLSKLPSDGARVVAKGLQRYGMLLADGGNIALTGQSDRFTQHKWKDVGVNEQSLLGIDPTDFEVVDMGPTLDGVANDCVLNP